MRPKLPDEDPLRAALDNQATTSLLDKVYRATRARMRMYSGGAPVESDAVDEMVHGVIADTLDRSLYWDHERKPLLQHMLDAVKYRVRDDARKRWRNKARFEVLDEDTTDMSVGESMLAGAEPERPDEVHAIRSIADQVVAELRERIAGDPEVERLIEAMVTEGALERAQIMKVTGMSAATYKNVRRRLDRMLLQLSPEIREAVMSAFTS